MHGARSVAPSPPRAALSTPGPWIESARFDVPLFLLSPLLGLALLLVAPSGASLVALVAGTLVGVPHYLSTFTFYFWRENRAYHRGRWLAFYAGPVLIAGLFALAVWARAFAVLQAVTYFWNAYHVSRQSCGVVSLYRHRSGVSRTADKTLANAALLAVNGFCVFWGLRHHPPVRTLVAGLHPRLSELLLAGAAAGAVAASAMLLVSFRARAVRGDGPRAPELTALASGLLLFHPYLWIEDSSLATLGMLMGHFVQYLGLVWLLHRRRFDPAAQDAPGWLARLSASLPLLLSASFLSGSVFLGATLLSQRLQLTGYFDAMFLVLAYTHFYLDGLFWAFKDPHVRHSLGPVLAAGPAVPAVAVR